MDIKSEMSREELIRLLERVVGLTQQLQKQLKQAENSLCDEKDKNAALKKELDELRKQQDRTESGTEWMWQELQRRLDNYCRANRGLREQLIEAFGTAILDTEQLSEYFGKDVK